MIMVDSTVVSVATSSISTSLNAGVNSVLWVTSAYLLAFTVPLLIFGRLGDRFGPRRAYLVGLVVFTLASLWAGLSGSIEMLIAARVAQGLGAALMTPQSMSIITRVFPAARRGPAMGVWGATSGAAILVGPIVGGLLIGSLGWQWVFFVNVPLGVLAFALVWRLVPRLDTTSQKFDIPGVIAWGVGLFLVIFGVQQGETYHWGQIVGPISVAAVIGTGLVVLAAFAVWQHVQRSEAPLLPLSLFRDRNFSLANIATMGAGFAINAIPFPLLLWAQIAEGFTPFQSALLASPMAVFTIILAPLVGRALNHVNPRWIAAFGFAAFAGAIFWVSGLITSHAAWGWVLLPVSLLGVASASVWSPLSVAATRDLPLELAGAGSGVYNSMRQIGGVLGTAGIAALMQIRLNVNLPGASATASTITMGTASPAMRMAFGTAMGQALLLPGIVVAVAGPSVLFLTSHPTLGVQEERATEQVAAGVGDV
jgi:EmrB/QacA subfamily drug resistance transporter